MGAPPFRIDVYTGAFAWRGTIGNPREVRFHPRFNDVSTVTIVLDADHHRVPDLVEAGARVVVDYGTQRISGRVSLLEGEGPDDSTLTVSVEGDERVLFDALGWPVPGNALGSQSSAYDERTGAAETVLKGYVTDNIVTRLGMPLTVATDQARGSSISAALRFEPLADRLIPAIESAGLGISVVQSGAGLILDVYEPAAYPRDLTETSGVVRRWAWSRRAPTATRVIAGDQGEATSRAFTTTVDAALESAWADVIETFVDVSESTDADTLTQRRTEALVAGAPRAGLSLELSESDGFRYGQTLSVGDAVTITVGPDLPITDILREAVITWNATDGLVVEPVVGERSDDATLSLVRFVTSLARGVRHLASGR